ncbi:MAG TPA: antibiotic biosynthesis monooxygenase [Candidatus Dormibacteraeota bacterium]|nr:antibiotic biosynthesis monooxygenase [Candidatus Dormibacteraeota bacterium]
MTRIRFKDERGPELEAEEARRQTADLRAQPGFRSFHVIRIDPREVVLVRIYDSQDELAAGLSHGFRPGLGELFADRPERLEGELLASVT